MSAGGVDGGDIGVVVVATSSITPTTTTTPLPSNVTNIDSLQSGRDEISCWGRISYQV